MRHVGAQQALNIKQCRVSAPEYSCNDVHLQSTCVGFKGSMKVLYSNLPNCKENLYQV